MNAFTWQFGDRLSGLRKIVLQTLVVLGVGSAVGIGLRRAQADALPGTGEQVPRQFTYRGTLKFANGAQPGPTALLRLSLYSLPVGGVLLYSERKIIAIDPGDGSFVVDVGDCTNATCVNGATQPQTLLQALQVRPRALYLGIAVCGTFTTAGDCTGFAELEGRQRILSSPMAHVTPGQVVGYWKSTAVAAAQTGQAGVWVPTGLLLSFTVPVKSTLVVHYGVGVATRDTGSISSASRNSISAGVAQWIPGGGWFPAFWDFSSAYGLRSESNVGHGLRNTYVENTFLIEGVSAPQALGLSVKTSSATGMPTVYPVSAPEGPGLPSFIEVTAYAE